jgi:soluble lytic murein transglycosylase-like protein
MAGSVQHATRFVGHGFALAVLLVSTVVLYSTHLDSGRDTAMPAQAGPLPTPAAVPSVTTAEPVATRADRRPSSVLPPAVERWRPLSRTAVATVQRVTGVGFDEDLLLALVAVESGGQPDARSAAGAVGLAQVEPATFGDLKARYGDVLGEGSLDQPRVNLLAGALYLAECARSLSLGLADPEQVRLVLHAYNLGPRAAARWRATGGSRHAERAVPGAESRLPAETVEHAARILTTYQSIRM